MKIYRTRKKNRTHEILANDQDKQELIMGLNEDNYFYAFLFEILIFKIICYLWLRATCKLYLCKWYWNISIFQPTWSLQNLETLDEYYFHGNMVIYKNSVRNCSLYNGTQLETGFITKAMTGMSCLSSIKKAYIINCYSYCICTNNQA